MSPDTANDILGYLNAGASALLGLVALRYWHQRQDSPSLWAALCFGALAFVGLAAQVLPDPVESRSEIVLQRLILVALLLFAYLLFRFAAAFDPSSPRLDRIAGLATLGLIGWTIASRDFPQAGEPRSTAFQAYLTAVVVQFGALSMIAAVRLWRAGHGQPSVARNRMRMLSLAAAGLTAAVFLGVVPSRDEPGLQIATSALGLASAIAFLLGLVPPAVVRSIWRRPEQENVLEAIGRLMASTVPEEITDNVLPPMRRLVGARAVFLLDAQGRLVGGHGSGSGTESPPALLGPDVERIEIPGGSLVVWHGPYAPFFGTDEVELLRSLGALTGLALDRARLFVGEREARLALERADELKTNFVALAAHELRTPVASIHGVVSTLDRLEEDLSETDRSELDEALRSQSERMRRLVDQLLDLSRLDTETVPIHPVPIPVRAEVDELVVASTGDRAGEVEVEVEDDLTAVVDPAVLERVTSNLLTNAFRHGRPPVRVTATQSDRHFRLAVEDSGQGVPPGFVGDLFERFSRSDEARARGLGSGLGLAIARLYARAHGGDLLYQPAEPHGARFELVVPANGRLPDGPDD